MCGRYCSDLTWDDIAKLYDLAMQGPPHWNFEPDYNVCPTDTVAAIVPAAEDMLAKRPVSKRINSSRTAKDDPTLIEPVALAA